MSEIKRPKAKLSETKTLFVEPEIDLMVEEAVSKLPPVEPLDFKGLSIVDRVKAIWAILDEFVESAVVVAEAFFGPSTGKQKKQAVVDMAMTWIEKVEDRINILPRIVERMVFTGIRFGLGVIVEKALVSARQRGEV